MSQSSTRAHSTFRVRHANPPAAPYSLEHPRVVVRFYVTLPYTAMTTPRARDEYSSTIHYATYSYNNVARAQLSQDRRRTFAGQSTFAGPDFPISGTREWACVTDVFRARPSVRVAGTKIERSRQGEQLGRFGPLCQAKGSRSAGIAEDGTPHGHEHSNRVTVTAFNGSLLRDVLVYAIVIKFHSPVNCSSEIPADLWNCFNPMGFHWPRATSRWDMRVCPSPGSCCGFGNCQHVNNGSLVSLCVSEA